MHQYSLQLGYSLGVNKLTNNFGVNWNRTNIQLTNYFTNTQNIAASLGLNILNGAAANPVNYGLPSVTLTQFTGLSEQQPNFQLNQTVGLSESSIWTHGKHNVRFGADFKRVYFDLLGQANSTGAFIFTGFATQGPDRTPTAAPAPAAPPASRKWLRARRSPPRPPPADRHPGPLPEPRSAPKSTTPTSRTTGACAPTSPCSPACGTILLPLRRGGRPPRHPRYRQQLRERRHRYPERHRPLHRQVPPLADLPRAPRPLAPRRLRLEAPPQHRRPRRLRPQLRQRPVRQVRPELRLPAALR